MLTGFVLGVITAFVASAVLSVVLVELADADSSESARVAEAGQPSPGDKRNQPKDDAEAIVEDGSVHIQADGEQLVQSP